MLGFICLVQLLLEEIQDAVNEEDELAEAHKYKRARHKLWNIRDHHDRVLDGRQQACYRLDHVPDNILRRVGCECPVGPDLATRLHQLLYLLFLLGVV